MTRVCCCCKIEKAEADFSPSQWVRKMTGRQSYCRWCRGRFGRKWAEKNKEKMREYHRKRHIAIMADPEKRAKRNRHMSDWGRALRNSAVAVLGDSCVCCQEVNPLFLDIDHINNDGHIQRKSGKFDIYTFYRSIRDGNTRGLQLLCANCNQGKRRNGGLCPHEEERAACALLIA